jgi:hypothetical protein
MEGRAMDKLPVLLALVLCTAFTASALADQPIYKWTDSQGTVHYSDKPPKDTAPDLQTLDLPPFPAQDPAKLAAEQTAQAADTAALLKQMQIETVLQQQQTALAQQQAQLAAAIAPTDAGDAADDVESVPVQPILVHSPLIPRAYRRNLYSAHPHKTQRPVSKGQPVMRAASGPAFRP